MITEIVCFFLTGKPSVFSREIEVIRLICEGAANKEIADKMKISEFTVRDHIKNILFKMDLHTRNEVLAFLINHAG